MVCMGLKNQASDSCDSYLKERKLLCLKSFFIISLNALRFGDFTHLLSAQIAEEGIDVIGMAMIARVELYIFVGHVQQPLM